MARRNVTPRISICARTKEFLIDAVLSDGSGTASLGPRRCALAVAWPRISDFAKVNAKQALTLCQIPGNNAAYQIAFENNAALGHARECNEWQPSCRSLPARTVTSRWRPAYTDDRDLWLSRCECFASHLYRNHVNAPFAL